MLTLPWCWQHHYVLTPLCWHHQSTYYLHAWSSISQVTSSDHAIPLQVWSANRSTSAMGFAQRSTLPPACLTSFMVGDLVTGPHYIGRRRYIQKGPWTAVYSSGTKWCTKGLWTFLLMIMAQHCHQYFPTKLSHFISSLPCVFHAALPQAI